METENLCHGDAHHAERVVVTQVLLYGKRQFYYVIYTLDVLGADSVFIESFPVKWRVIVGVCYYLPEFLTLQCAHLVTRHTFHFPVPNHRYEVGKYSNRCKIRE